MSTETRSISLYETRIAIAQDVLLRNTNLDQAAARILAKQLLHAVDTIPEKIR